MQPEQKEIIRRTFAQIAPIAPAAAALFYSRLFEAAPPLQRLFRHQVGSPGMDQQGAKLMQTIAVAVANLDALEQVTPALAGLARRHVAYGVEPAHYDTVGAALLWTLEQGLGEAFTPQAAAAWGALYHTLADTMKRAAYGEPALLAADHAGAA